MNKILKYVLIAAVLFLPVCALCDVQINEVMLSNAVYENGEAYEWIELKNAGTEAVSLTGWKICYTRKGEEQSFVFPSGQKLAAGKYVIVYLTGYDQVDSTKSAYYAPIDVSKKGGTISLYDEDGTLRDEMELGEQQGNVSYGRIADGESLGMFENATKGSANEASGYADRAQTPIFSLSGGFYDEAQSVEIYAREGTKIYYTLDGSTPTEKSTLYTGAIKVSKGVSVLRARAFGENLVSSTVSTQSYFIGVERNVPVVSLVTDDKYLTNSKTGLLVPGNGKTANYYKDWEYPINVEYYSADHEQQINQMATFRITGATSRKYGQKAISLFARSALGDKLFYFNPFSNREGYEGYKALTLRAGGTESYKTRFKDAMLTSLAQGEGIFYQESVTCVCYINGKYWGQYNLRERINKASLAAWEGIDDKETQEGVTIIKGHGEVQQGSIDEWNELLKFFKTKDLTVQENLDYVLERFDVDSYFTMVAFEIICGNGDIGNQRFYKFPGGKWKYVLYDLDAAMQNTKKTPMNYFLKTVKQSNNLFYHQPFAALMKNAEMKDKFLTICGRILADKFTWSNLEALLNEWVDRLEPLMEEQISRWPKCSPKSIGTWKYEVNAYKKILKTRPKTVVTYLVKQYKLTDEQKEYYFGEFLNAE